MNKINDAFKVPLLPADLPFDSAQTQWLSGFLAGLHSRLLVTQDAMGAALPAAQAKRPLTIIVGTQTGNAEMVANDCADAARQQGLEPRVLDMDDAELADLAQCERLLVVTSTYGEGEMPDNAQALWDDINSDDAPRFENTFFSVLALGDTSYDEFCLAGKEWDQRLEALGATRIADRVDCDLDYDEPAAEWIGEVVPMIKEKGSDAAGPAGGSSSAKPKSKYNRKNPLLAPLTVKRLLNGSGSSKEIMHYEFSLAESGETYDAGDALNIMPLNQPKLVDELLGILKLTGDESVEWLGNSYQLRELLTEEVDIRIPSKEFIALVAERTDDEVFQEVIASEDNTRISDFLYGKDVVDLLMEHPKVTLTVDEFLHVSKSIAPRAYSISSSIKKHPAEVHLTIGNVRYEHNGREHNGICSSYLSDLVETGTPVKCYFSANKSFSVPEDDNAPMIMVGPGTGVAPFRAFLEEREMRNANGDNWLFFGDRNRETDFIYQDELEAMQASGLLNRLDLAFSRDQKDKIYVQDRMRENGRELFAWLENGGYFFVCGDAFRMAKDVDKALLDIVAEHGNLSEQQAEAYVSNLKKSKRYVRDVY